MSYGRLSSGAYRPLRDARLDYPIDQRMLREENGGLWNWMPLVIESVMNP